MKIWKWKGGNLQNRNENGNFVAEVKTEMERRNRCGNGSFCFRLIQIFRFMVVLHSQYSRPNMWLCHIKLSKQTTPTPPLHQVILSGLRNKFFDLLDLLEYSYMILWYFGSDNHPLFIRVHTVFISCMFSEVSIFIFVSGVSVFIFTFV
jgi:hypothetical protein